MDYITESWLLHEDNYEINLDKWKPGTPLWITGTSGDGKSTLAKKLAEKYNAIICPTDILLVRMGWSEEKWNTRMQNPASLIRDPQQTYMAMDYINAHPEIPFGNGGIWGDSEFTNQQFLDFFRWVLKNAKLNPKFNTRRVIVEGCDIYKMDPEFMAKQPLIILGLSRLGAMRRRIHRQYNDGDGSYIKIAFNQIKKYNKTNRKLDYKKELFRKNVRDEVEFNNFMDSIGLYDEITNPDKMVKTNRKLIDNEFRNREKVVKDMHNNKDLDFLKD